jgi:predicted  nucleic acid-binding Zn-ribbon protein
VSTLSKILVVILVILAIAHSGVLLAYLSQQQSWKTLAQGLQSDLDSLRTKRASDSDANDLIQKGLARDKRILQDQLATTESRRIQAEANLIHVQGQLGKLKTDNDTFRQQLANLTDSLARAQRARDHASDQLDAARNAAKKLEAENAGLERSVAELTRDLRQLNSEVRFQKQQIAALRDEIRKASQRTTVRAPVVLPPRRAPLVARLPINGEVVSVDLEAKIATVNVGSIAGVSPGTRFTIFDHDYVGDLTITRVFGDRALGTIVASARAVQVGDEVSTDPLR